MAVFLFVVCAPVGRTLAGTSTSTTPNSVSTITPTIPHPPAAHALDALAFANALHGWAAGQGVILGTTNGGSTWVSEWNGRQTVDDLDALDARRAWAVAGTSLLATSDGGQRWLRVAQTSRPLLQVHFLSPSVGFAIEAAQAFGSPGTLVGTGDGGRTWRPVPGPEHAASLCFTDAAHAWVGTGTDGLPARVFATADGGRQWASTSPLPLAAGAEVGCAPPSVLWSLVYGGVGMMQESYSVYRSTDAGRGWHPVLAVSTGGAGPAPGDPQGVQRGPGSSPGPFDVVNASTAVVLGGCEACFSAGSLTPAETTDGGRVWREEPAIAGVTDLGAPAVSFISASRGWLIADQGVRSSVILATTNGGRTWRQQYPSAAPRPIYGIDFVNQRLGYGIGMVGDGGAVLRTDNGGHTWIIVGRVVPPTPYQTSLSFVNAEDGWVVAGTGELMATRDGGRTWFKVPIPPLQASRPGPVPPLGSVSLVTASTGCAAPAWLGQGVDYGTTDGGRIWRTEAPAPNAWICAARLAGLLPGRLRGGALLPLKDAVWSGGGRGWLWAATSLSLFTSTDGGRMWTRHKGAGGADLSFADSQYGWMLRNGALLATTDGGATWRPVSPKAPKHVSPQVVAAWETATSPVTKLPPLGSLSPGHVEHAWIRGSSSNESRLTLLTPTQIDHVTGWLRSASVTTYTQQCPANPLPLGSTLYLDIRGIGVLAVTNALTCTATDTFTTQLALSKTYVTIGGYSLSLAFLTSPGLARFLIQQWMQY